jgi:ribosome maturation factor RimP
MTRTNPAQLRELLSPVVSAAGYDLEDVELSSAGRRSVVRVIVDRDGGVDLDAVAEISRPVSDALDAADAFGESAYVLEVTSPGVDRPLTAPRHWRRNVGRLVEVDGIKGRIVEATDEGVTLDVDGAQREVTHAELGSGKVIVEFSR